MARLTAGARQSYGCNQSSDCPGYGICKNGKCEFPILGPGPQEAQCTSNYDCGHLGTCVEGQCDYLAAQPYTRRGMYAAQRYPQNSFSDGHSEIHNPSGGNIVMAGHVDSRRQRRQARTTALRSGNPYQLKDPWASQRYTLKDPWASQQSNHGSWSNVDSFFWSPSRSGTGETFLVEGHTDAPPVCWKMCPPGQLCVWLTNPKNGSSAMYCMANLEGDDSGTFSPPSTATQPGLRAATSTPPPPHPVGSLSARRAARRAALRAGSPRSISRSSGVVDAFWSPSGSSAAGVGFDPDLSDAISLLP